MTEQLSLEDVARLRRERRFDEFDQARQDGRLDRLLGVPEEQISAIDRARNGRIDIDDVKTLNQLGRHELVAQAQAEGRIDYPNQEN